jgi:hypothetical protein
MVSCNLHKQPDKPPIEHKDERRQPSTIDIRSVKIFENDKNFKIIDLFEQTGSTSREQDKTICKQWLLSKEQISKIIKQAEPITNHEWHYMFLHLPCFVSGQIIQNNNLYHYKINGGSWIRIYTKDTSILYGSFKKENEKYFLEKVDMME